MIRLNREQQTAVECGSNVVITACPGSGKTRVLTARVIRGLSELNSGRERVVALTFTNRAADEIQVRLDQENIAADCLWAGTIHAFALEWVLRPYAPYSEITRFGFTVADEFYTERLLDELRREVGLHGYTEISTALTRTGAGLNVCIPTQNDHPLRSIPTTCYDSKRPPVTIQSDRPLRRKPTTQLPA